MPSTRVSDGRSPRFTSTGGVATTPWPGQFTSWAFSQKVRDAGLAPSIGAIGCPYDNAVGEAFWGRVQVELLDRKSWQTRIELASAIHDYIELFHNARRRHSALGMLTPTEYEERYFQTRDAA